MIRPIGPADWRHVVALEARTYGGGPQSEHPLVLRSRAAASPDTCFVLTDPDADAVIPVIGYLLALPYPAGRYPDLTQPERDRHTGDNLHLHDLVIVPAQRRRGWGSRLLGHLAAVAAGTGLARISLCAVPGSSGFWAARGFRVQPEVVLPAGYGAGAVYMARPIEGARVA